MASTADRTDSEQGLPVSQSWAVVGLAVTPIRWAMAWIFFSAFWRRVVLVPDKLDPSSAAYVGYKFNHFLPHALWWVKDMIEALVTHEHVLYGFLLAFTIIEGLVGLSLAFGFLTRLGGIGAACLSWGILMGSGWLGSTCLDEWQIGTMGIASGIVVFLAGSGPWSLDNLWRRRWPDMAGKLGLRLVSSGPLGGGRPGAGLKILVLGLGLFGVGWYLYTNQAFAGGVVGKLHNLSKKPDFEIPSASLAPDGRLTITLYRIDGPDSYGAFIVGIDVIDDSGQVVESFRSRQLSAIPAADIQNRYLVKLRPGPYGLEAPLGSYSTVTIPPATTTGLASGTYTIEVHDVSGAKWSKTASVP